MNKIMLIIVGMALGSLLTLALHIPLFPPFDDNTATVLASLASTALAVAGAVWLWWHQGDQRGKDIKSAAIPVFQNFYITLLQVRVFVDLSSTQAFNEAFRVRSLDGASDELTPHELVKYRHKQFFNALDGAIREARIAVQHWDGMQDALLSIRPPSLNSLLTLSRYTRHAIDELSALSTRAQGTVLSQIPPVLDAQDRQRLDEAISMLAQHLNALDGGSRDESGAERVRSTEEAYEVYLTSSKPLGSAPPPEDAAILIAARHRPPPTRKP